MGTLWGVLEEILTRQRGLLTWRQAIACGLTRSQIAARVRSRRWTRVLPRVYATFTGELPRAAQLWAVVLRAGRGAVLSHETAAELAGLVDRPAAAIHVTVPADRRVVRIPGAVVHLSRRAGAAAHPSRLPPQTRVEETVLDLVDRAGGVDEALGWVVQACARRRTTPAKLRAALRRRARLRWRRELTAALADIADGAHSLLELRYLRDVERAHGLPTGQRQAVRRRRGGRWYDDVHYREYRTRVELDGRVAHPDEDRFRDMRRDNAAAADGDAVLRYGWADVTGTPCGCARQVGTVLRRSGWRGAPHPCGPGCPARTAPS